MPHKNAGRASIQHDALSDTGEAPLRKRTCLEALLIYCITLTLDPSLVHANALVHQLHACISTTLTFADSLAVSALAIDKVKDVNTHLGSGMTNMV